MRLYPFKDYVRAAAANGFTDLSITDMQNMAEDHGVPLCHFDTLATWAPVQIAVD